MTISSDQTLTVTLRMVSPEETLSGNMVGMQSIFSVRDQTGKEIAKGRFLDELEKQFGVMEYSELLKEAFSGNFYS